jgi:hypothetical protein
MQFEKSVNATDPDHPDMFSESRERKMVLLLCCLAAVHVFIFSAAFPLFNNVDEYAHIDVAVKYAHGHVPRGLEPLSKESIQYLAIYDSQEFMWPSNHFPIEQFPPPWTQPMEKMAPMLLFREAFWNNFKNHEATQPPLYYVLAGIWWHLGQWLGFEGGGLLYWVRFLNILFVAALVWLGHAAARKFFPENLFLRLGVPALLAFMPQTAFYSINSDVLSPLCFGAAFICLAKVLRMEIPGARLGTFAGLALAATFLAKMSNLPLLGVAFAAVILKIARLAKAGKLRASLPSLASLFFCAGLPMAAWLAWCKINFGDFTGSAAKIHMLTWTVKPFGEWWSHPIFTPHGFWFFIHDLLSTFWRGEFVWHRLPLASPPTDMVYVVLTFILLGVAFLNLPLKPKIETSPQREELWFGLACFIASVAFLGFLSIIYDFHDCFYPSRAEPYFVSGRLMLGALVPFTLLFVFGLDRALKCFRLPAKIFALTAMVLFMLISEIVTDWPVFSSQYNWFHM